MKSKVFIVDDDPVMVMKLSEQLTDAGYHVTHCSVPEQALDQIRTQHPDIIICDILMPQMDGYELHQRLRQHPETANIPFVFLSAKDQPTDQLEGLRMGADDYVCKPPKIKNLIARMEQVMDRARTASEFRSQADFSGDLDQMRINDVIQIVELNHKSGELVFYNGEGGPLGIVYFSSGRLIHATVRYLQGEEAFYQLMNEACEKFEFFGRKVDVEQTISLGNMAILLKGNRMMEQARQVIKRIPDMSVVPRYSNNGQAFTNGELSVEETEIINLVDKGYSLESILDCEIMSRPGTIITINKLITKGIIQIPGYDGPEDVKEESAEISPLSDTVTSMSFWDLLTTIHQQQQSGKVVVDGLSDEAVIEMDQGQVVHAQFGNTRGKKALFRIFATDIIDYRFLPGQRSGKQTIRASFQQLIEQGEKQARALQRLSKQTLQLKLELSHRIPESAKPIVSTPVITHLLPLVQRYGRIQDILDASRITDFETYQYLSYLIRQKVIRVAESNHRQPYRIVTESSADLPETIREQLDIVTIANNVRMGTGTYEDGPQFVANTLFRKMRNSRVIPNTLAPAPDIIHQVFSKIVPDKDVLAIFQSGHLGHTVSNAKAAKKIFKDEYTQMRQRHQPRAESPVLKIVDSKQVSLGLGLVVLEAAQKARQNWSLSEICDHINWLLSKMRILIIADSLENLKKFRYIGRIRKIWAHLAKAKPVLTLHDGQIAIVDYLRNEDPKHYLLNWMAQTMVPSNPSIRVAIMHADRLQDALQLQSMIGSKFNCAKQDIIISCLGPVLTGPCGLGTLGIAYHPLEIP